MGTVQDEQSVRSVADEAVALLYARNPGLDQRYGPTGREKCSEDIQQTMMFIVAASARDSYDLLLDYLGWMKILFARLGIRFEDMTGSLACLAEALDARRTMPESKRAAAMLRAALRDLDRLPAANGASLIIGDGGATMLARDYLDALLIGDKRRASEMILAGVESGMAIKNVYLEVFQPALREVGRLWHIGKITVADEHFVTASTQATMSRLYPYIFTGMPKARSMVATCVSGELHEIGMRMVADFFEMAGWDSYYLGANVPAADLLATLRAKRAAVLGISATLTRHLGEVATLVSKARAEFGSSLIILVGGYPFNVDRELWRRVGADGMASDASKAVETASALEDAG